MTKAFSTADIEIHARVDHAGPFIRIPDGDAGRPSSAGRAIQPTVKDHQNYLRDGRCTDLRGSCVSSGPTV